MNMCAKAFVLLAAVACSIIACSSQDNGGERASSDDGDAAVDGSPSSDDDPQQASASNQRTQPTANGSRSARPNVDRAGRDDERTTPFPAKLRTTCVTSLDCQDGVSCNGVELCTNGECTPGVPPILDDQNPCTNDFCDEVLGVLHTPWPAGHPCPNGNACDGAETCNGAGVCQSGTPPTVSDGNACTDDACDPAIGVTHTPRPAGDPACSDSNACNGLETCNGAGGCQSGTAPPLDDNNFCTVDTCDPGTGPVHTPIANCDPTPSFGDAPFETRASLLGKLRSGTSAVTGASFAVTDAPLPGGSPNPPRSDVSVSTASDGSFRLRLTSFPETESDRTPPVHVVLKISHGSYITAFRDVWLHAGNAVDLGEIKLIARDTNVTNIGPSGGTATDSTGRLEVVVPAGALATTVPIVITSIPNRDEMPARLPDETPTLYGFELEPSGTTFAVPVTVRHTNWRNAPQSLPIPAGVYDEINGRWDNLGVATWDAGVGRFAFTTTHFSTIDLNYVRAGGPLAAPGPGPGPKGPCSGVGSSCSLAHGSLEQGLRLPSYRVKNEDFAITLDYRSGPASSWKLGKPQPGYDVVAHSDFAIPIEGTKVGVLCVPSGNGSGFGTPQVLQPGTCTAEGPVCAVGRSTPISLTLKRSLAGAAASESQLMGLTNTEAQYDAYLTLPLASVTESTANGLYRMRTSVSAGTSGSCISTGDTFGVSDPALARTQTSLEPGPLATIDTHVLVHHRLTSPFGSGWGIREVSRVYRAGDVAHLVGGDGEPELFRPRAHVRTMNGAPPARFVLTRDPVTGEIFAALDNGQLATVNPATGAFTSVLSGLAFDAEVHALSIAYVGGVRRFIVALKTRLLEIDSAGARTELATRAAGAPFSQAAVAANGDAVFYADGNGAQLYRISLTDPSRTVTPMTLATGGDVRVWPQATLSGVRFGEPRALVFAPGGTLYMADRRRNVVYEIVPDGTGAITGSSAVRAVVGDGSASVLPPLGERYPGTGIGVREPVGLTLSEDGYLIVATTYGFMQYDPLAREVEWLTTFGFVGEVTAYPLATRFGALALTPTSILSREESFPFSLVRFDIDRMSSEFVPTRTIRRLTGGQLELLDTTAETIEVFDAAGRLIERKRRTGETTMAVVYADASSNKIAKVVDPAGGETVFSYDARDKIQSITDARGRTTTFTINGFGDLVTLDAPGSETHTFVYDEHRMTEKHSPRNDVTTYTFRDDGTLFTATKPEGAITTLDAARSRPAQYNATTAKAEYAGSYTDQHGVAHSFVLNMRGDMEKDTYVIDGVTRTDTLTYAPELFDRPVQDGGARDVHSRRRNVLSLVERRATNGVIGDVATIFDAHARPFLEYRWGDPAGFDSRNVRRWFYDPNGWLKELYTGQSNKSSHYERDGSGHVTKIFDASPGIPTGFVTGRETVLTYRADGLVATRVDHGVTRTFSYDDVGGTKNELGWTDTLGRSMTYTHDARGNITSTNDGTATTFADFDARNRVIATRDALGNETTYGYTHAGCNCSLDDLVTSIHTPDLAAGVDWEMTYDGDRRLKTVTDPHGFTESYDYEPTGEMKKLVDKLARQTTWTHDALGRMKSMIDTLGRHHGNVYTTPLSSAYSGPSLMAGSNDGTAASTSLTGTMRSGDYQIGHNAYQLARRPPAISLYRDATFQLAYTEYYDSALSPRLVQRADRTGFAFDSTALPGYEGPVFNHAFTWSPTTSMPLLSGRDSQAVAHRLRFNRDKWLDVGFQAGGNALSSEPGEEETFTRDAGGRVTQARHAFFSSAGSPIKFSDYVYRSDGRLGRVTNPDGIHDFTYNSRGLAQTQTVTGEGTYTYGYDEMGRNDYLEYPDGHVRRQVFDDVGRMLSRCYEYSGGPATRCYTATYDAVGNPVSMLDPEGEDVFEYDALDRLKKATRKDPNGNVLEVDEYEYNALGALKKNANVVLDDQRARLDGAGNAASSMPATTGGQAITLDGAGRVTSLRGTTIGWGKGDTPVSVQEPIPAALEKYGIDGELRRVVKLRGSTAEFYFYEGLDRVATLDAAGNAKEGYLFDGIDHPLRIKVPATSTVAYYELDLAGNVRRLRNSGGSDLGGYRYTAFGQTKEDTATLVQPLRWKARWHSTLNGAEVYDVRARQWAPEIGAFLSIDKYRFHDPKWTLWSWPNQNAIRFDDPTGHTPSGGQCSLDPFVDPCKVFPMLCPPKPTKYPCRPTPARDLYCRVLAESAGQWCIDQFPWEQRGHLEDLIEDQCSKERDATYDACICSAAPVTWGNGP